MIVPIAAQYSSEEAITFLTGIQDKLAAERQPFLFLDMQLAQLQLDSGDLDACRTVLDNSRSFVEASSGVDNAISANFYLTSSKYFKATGNASDFYKSTLLYLAFVELDLLTHQQQLDIAYDLTLAALFSDRIYNFGELLLHPVLNVLKESEHSWILEALQAFNSGDIPAYESISGNFEKLIESNGHQLVAELSVEQGMSELKQKMNLLALMELVFQKDKDDRIVAFQEVAEVCSLNTEDVEWLLMKALSLGLIKGLIDEVDQTVSVNWVQPRVLDMDQIQVMTDRIVKWGASTKETLYLVEDQASPLMG
eukprot:TRINITY_DN2880_c0_g1_i1.p1 TRINITY_DN2880_c0_g1~~TRINITY_DN2880_c0_g1_i1.p1  ORF type:complete len:310 (-),score=107.66 TRINITY_DN2880_c0_g1_i1:31-960(-)